MEETLPRRPNWALLVRILRFGITASVISLMSTAAQGQSEPSDLVKKELAAAEEGDANSQHMVGWMYETGTGVEADRATALIWYRKAANQGHEAAKKDLERLLGTGSTDSNVAVALLEPVAQSESEPSDTVKERLAAAEQGDAAAQYHLGLMYETGEGVPEDMREAVKWYRKAAEQGLAHAQNNLGLMYFSGEGVPQDFREAVKWFRRSAEQGFATAQYNLGRMYDHGEGVTQDQTEAVTWFRKAGEQGFAAAQFNLAVIYDEGDGVPEDDKEAWYWYYRAAIQGHPGAQHNLGLLYVTGRGTEKDKVEAYAWFNIAAANGVESGKENKERLIQQLSREQIAEAQKYSREMVEKNPRLLGE